MKLLLVAFVSLAVAGCSTTTTSDNGGVVSLDDGLYSVVNREDERTSEGPHVVELLEVSGDADATEHTVLIVDEPILRFREVTRHEFIFDKTTSECTQIALANTDSLKAFFRNHIGGRLAVVVDGKVVSSHKIRNPVETENVTITFCTEGGGDKVYSHLKTVLPSQSQ